jgi:ribonuclease PH
MAKKKIIYARPDGRKADELRPVQFKKSPAPASPGSVLVKMGNTQLICAASIEPGVPRWMRADNVEGGWMTAEYSLLPYATKRRTRREVNNGRVGGRTHEIQRLIGRSLRAVTDLKKMGSRTAWIDCDVLEADGGTRTAAVTGAYVALRLAVDSLLKKGVLSEDPIIEPLAAVSVGVVEGQPLLDLCYKEDFAAEVDMNVVMTASGKFIEVQGTAEEAPFSRTVMQKMLKMADKGIGELIEKQQAHLKRRGK